MHCWRQAKGSQAPPPVLDELDELLDELELLLDELDELLLDDELAPPPPFSGTPPVPVAPPVPVVLVEPPSPPVAAVPLAPCAQLRKAAAGMISASA